MIILGTTSEVCQNAHICIEMLIPEILKHNVNNSNRQSFCVTASALRFGGGGGFPNYVYIQDAFQEAPCTIRSVQRGGAGVPV